MAGIGKNVISGIYCEDAKDISLLASLFFHLSVPTHCHRPADTITAPDVFVPC